MSIHYENYSRFSKGQGFAGVACRTVSAQASSPRFSAVDCTPCKETLIDKKVISRRGVTGKVTEVDMTTGAVWIRPLMDRLAIQVPFRDLDADWTVLNLDEIFGAEGGLLAGSMRAIAPRVPPGAGAPVVEAASKEGVTEVAS